MYGGSTWIVKSSEDVKIQHLNIVFDDELHLIVNLNGGGTAILECQINSINGYLREKNQKKYLPAFFYPYIFRHIKNVNYLQKNQKKERSKKMINNKTDIIGYMQLFFKFWPIGSP